MEENPYTAPPAVTTEKFYLYFNAKTVVGLRTTSGGGNILIERVEPEFKVF